jgi:hypothetical protein
MIQDKALSDRLNAVKAGKEIPKPSPEVNPLNGVPEMEEREYEVPEFSMKDMFLSSLISFAEISIMSLFYGFGIMTLFSKDWNLLGILGVGLLVNQAFSLISSLKLFK